MTLRTIARSGINRVMVSVLLRNKGMARGTITVGGHTLMTLVT